MITFMSPNSRIRPANSDEVNLYSLIGEALCTIQFLEDALNHSIILKNDVKKPYSVPLKKANELLDGYRTYTLGRAVKLAKKKGLYHESLQHELELFLLERNWLVHKSMHQIISGYSERGNYRFFEKIKGITEQAHSLTLSLERDLIEFSISKGLDMSHIQAFMREHYE